MLCTYRAHLPLLRPLKTRNERLTEEFLYHQPVVNLTGSMIEPERRKQALTRPPILTVCVDVGRRIRPTPALGSLRPTSNPPTRHICIPLVPPSRLWAPLRPWFSTVLCLPTHARGHGAVMATSALLAAGFRTTPGGGDGRIRYGVGLDKVCGIIGGIYGRYNNDRLSGSSRNAYDLQ